MEVYLGAHTISSSMAEGNGVGAFMFVLLPNVAACIFFWRDSIQPRPTASLKEHHACTTAVEILFPVKFTSTGMFKVELFSTTVKSTDYMVNLFHRFPCNLKNNQVPTMFKYIF